MPAGFDGDPGVEQRGYLLAQFVGGLRVGNGHACSTRLKKQRRGHATFAAYLELQRMPQIGELTIFCGAMVGSAIGFLWYNAHPAEVFMGDVGSLALGGAIGTVAVMIKQELLLPFIGGIFVIEAFSVIIQVVSYKTRKKRVFKMAPLHHHFELLGWSESKIIVRFWIASLVFALFALTTLKLR